MPTARESLLGVLCDSLGVPFDEAMLNWPPGTRPTDGIWAKHWYAAVERTTTFEPYRPKPDPVPDRFRDVHEQAEALYQRLYPHRLRP